MAEISNRPWSDFTDASYADAAGLCAASLIDLNPDGKPKSKALCKLPVREPGGALSRGGVHAAAAALAGGRGGVDAPPAAKRAAARRLVSLYGQLNEDPPESIRRMAAG